jgi:hypothetical protein
MIRARMSSFWDLQRARELQYKSLDAADHADVSKAALIAEGSPLIPAILIAITNGDLAAVLVFKFRSESLYGTSKPMMVTPPI